MARPLRIEFPGGIYHVTSRGNARAAIFVEDADRRLFLSVLAQVIGRYGWLCHAYCLMDNHYHLLVETPDPNLSRGMRQLNGLYTQRFNRRHESVGHLLQGRFKSVIVDREGYLLELCRYVVLNPVRAGMARWPDEHAWSSYRATAGLEPVPEWLASDWILAQFGAGPGRARARYREFVVEGIRRPSPWADLRGQVLLGSQAFVDRLEPRLSEHAEAREVPKRQRLAHRPALGELFGPDVLSNLEQRNAAIRRAVTEHQYTLAAIGRHVGLHYATISRIAREPIE